jgi:hypothetical protein
MDPNNPNQNQYSIDYLNEISAPQQKQPAAKDKLFFFIIGGGLLIAIIVFALTLLNGGSGPTQKMQTLSARLTTLQKISSDTQKNLKSTNLRSINSNLTIFLTNTNRDIVAPLATNNVDVKKISADITAKESGTDLTKKFEDARLNAVLDRTYAREMTYQLQTVAALLQEIYDATGSKSLKEFLEKTNSDLTPIIKQLSDFTGVEG